MNPHLVLSCVALAIAILSLGYSIYGIVQSGRELKRLKKDRDQ